MMRGLQICPQNSNQTTFDSPFGAKTVKIGKLPDLANFDIFWSKGSQVLFYLNVDARFGIPHHLTRARNGIQNYAHGKGGGTESASHYQLSSYKR